MGKNVQKLLICRLIYAITKTKFKKEWFKRAERLPFETISVPVPVGYDEILKQQYGDYMTPDKDRGRAHDYPFYKEQEEFLIKKNLL